MNITLCDICGFEISPKDKPLFLGYGEKNFMGMFVKKGQICIHCYKDIDYFIDGLKLKR